MKSVFFIGTIAELIKTFPVMIEMKNRKIDFDIIATGQNNLDNDDILKIFDLPSPKFKIIRATKNQTPIGLLIWAFLCGILGLVKTGIYILKNKPKYFIVHGDTISTAIGSIFGKLFFRKVVHIEAGCRSGNLFRPFPEEIDRIITDFFSDIYFCPNKESYNNLKGKKGINIDCKYNTAVDALYFAQKELESKIVEIEELKGKKYFTWVMHRPENVGDKDYVYNMVDIILSILEKYNDLTCFFYLHSNTKSGLETFGLLNKIENHKRIILTNRVPFIENISILQNCEFMISDGGGNQQECSFLGIPLITSRKETETPDSIGYNGILSVDKKEILSFVDNYKNYKKPLNFPKDLPHKLIVNKLEQYGG